MTINFATDAEIPDRAPYENGRKLRPITGARRRHLRRKLEALQRKLAKLEAKKKETSA